MHAVFFLIGLAFLGYKLDWEILVGIYFVWLSFYSFFASVAGNLRKIWVNIVGHIQEVKKGS